MKIGIDVSRYFDRSAGVGIYAANLLKSLGRVDPSNQYLAYSFFYNCLPDSLNDKQLIEEFVKDFPRLEFAQARASKKSLVKKWKAASMEKKEAMLGNPDIVHSTAYTLPQLFSSRLVVTVHDLSFLIFPQYHTSENYQWLFTNLMYLNSRPDAVICDSEQTRRDVVKYFHVPEGKLEVVYLGVDKQYFEKMDAGPLIQSYGLEPGYLLCVSSIEPRKNFERIIRVFAQLVKQPQYEQLKLVCVGGQGWKNTNIFELVQELGLEEKVKFLGYVEQEKLPGIYQGASIFLYPSLYEGFGLPVLEAMASGTPVITSDVSSLPEVAGQAAIMIDPYDEKQLYDSIQHLLVNKGKRQELSRRGSLQAQKFSWEQTARNTLEVYKKVYKENALET